MTAFKKFKLAILLIVSVIIFGTIGYMVIEKGTLVESLYMTVITISTVGFKEVFSLSVAGRIFTIFLIFSSISILAFGINIINSFIIEGEFRDVSRRKKMEKKLKRLRDHYVLCGCGQTAQQIIKQFQDANVKFVVILHVNEVEDEKEKIRSHEDIIYIEGNATDDETLERVNIQQASGLIAALSADTDNLFLILSAKSLNPNLRIVARAVEESSLQKMKKAGASHVISPDIIGGTRMASVVLRPAIVDFLDTICKSSEDVSLKMEQVIIPQNSRLNGKTLKELQIPKETGLIVVSVRKKDSKSFTYNPGSDYVLGDQDVLVVLGQDEQIQKLLKYIRS